MFFAKFPKILYDIRGDGNTKIVTDLLRRVKIKSSIKDNVVMFDSYDVQSGESPETIAYKLYGDSKYHYVILLLNNITDRYYGWPLSDYDFEVYVTDKYVEPGAPHHYEITQSSGRTKSNGPNDYSYRIEVNSYTAGAEAITNYEYERRLQDKLRQIELLNPAYLSVFDKEYNKLISI